MEPITFAELSTMIYFSLDAKRYLDAQEAEFKLFDLDTELACLRTGPNEVVVVFLGSCSIVDWTYNLKFWMVPFALDNNPEIKVHHGMNEKIKVTFDFLDDRIKPTDTVYFTGHSLGGGLSLLAAYGAKTRIGANIGGVYVFGTPPVGNREWQKAYNGITELREVTHDYMIKGDWVGFLPLKCFGYRPVGRDTVNLEAASYFPNIIHKHLPWTYVGAIRKYYAEES